MTEPTEIFAPLFFIPHVSEDLKIFISVIQDPLILGIFYSAGLEDPKTLDLMFLYFKGSEDPKITTHYKPILLKHKLYLKIETKSNLKNLDSKIQII